MKGTGVKPKAKSSCESQKRFPYQIGRGPGQQPGVLLTHRVLWKLDYCWSKTKKKRRAIGMKKKR